MRRQVQNWTGAIQSGKNENSGAVISRRDKANKNKNQIIITIIIMGNSPKQRGGKLKKIESNKKAATSTAA